MVLLTIIILAFLIFVCNISFSAIFDVFYLFLTIGFTYSSISSLKKGNIGNAISEGIPAAILIFILVKVMF